MSEYIAPLKDIRFVMQDLAGLDQVVSLPGCEEASPDVVDAILEEAAKFSGEVLSPLNRVGDRDGAKWKDKVVTTSPGFKEAYRQFVDNGWNGIGCDPEFGGQGLPKLLSTAVSEMWKSANHAFSLCPMLTQGAIEALMIAGTDEQKAAYLPNLVSGEWTGTMNLTEPSAGSDLAAVRSRAEPVGDGTFKIFGQKIFITYGEHDMTDNIAHLVLARTPNAPEGVKGISLFVVPKFLLKADGSPGKRNDVYCVSIEHKLGIHGSPTAVLAFGDNGGAIGTLVGEENRGLEYMFIMMNAARFNVGLEGLGDAERAYQRAAVYAKERVQGTEVGVRGGPKVPIIKHPDVRRMLMSMRSRIEAMRALAYVTAAAQDNAHGNPDEAERKKAQAFADLLIPVVKGWSTESAIDIASLGVQVHGGMGYIEETGAAQHLRDARITAIYEGTTAIQANDLIGRKIAREKGVTIKGVIAEMRSAAAQLDGEFALIGVRQKAAVDALEKAVDWLVANFATEPKAAHAGAVPFLHLFGIVAGGWQMGRAAVIARVKIASGETDPFWASKLATSRFFADHFLTQAQGLAESVVAGAAGGLEIPDDCF
ncbi:acyl-CoA dehydrogenase [Ferribacterium limneticum]|uniref:acyl-CoA dehydrogenase n=1 Tax=Ferribacterium limneticum TaxID=76259 RepID=UPI001CF946C7|nr:acyl-CoA dehydrogenase [Ferribacterium limneticum]UCV27242.1 acyl-CoA dehydrogenase [Ferribacterium limneticum]UCV31159.1 acyl-CoA dehydrogenase [Ferribacterium limneticum]